MYCKYNKIIFITVKILEIVILHLVCIMIFRFGPNVEKLECIRKHLESLNQNEQIQIPEVIFSSIFLIYMHFSAVCGNLVWECQ